MAETLWFPPERFEEYRLVRPLGQGGMGQVFLAHDTYLDRPVAVKFISALRPGSVARERFLIEARAAARLHHPNVVGVYRVGELSQRPFLVSEFIHGRSLDKLARPVPFGQVLQIGVGLVRGLAAAHRHGILHRDIKPANAILAETGEVKLLDFGLAKLVQAQAEGSTPPPVTPALSDVEMLDQTIDAVDAADSAGVVVGTTRLGSSAPSGELTQAGARVGTPYYMAPEIWGGEPATQRSDVYSMGVVLYELIVGSPPRREISTADALARVVQERDPPPLLDAAPNIDPRFAAIVDRCRRRDPAQRYASGDELREALERLAAPPAALAVPEGNPYRGLAPFEAEHRGLFFGRGAEVRAVIERLRSEPLLLVVADSGLGKSSLCRAGVLPLVGDGALGGERRWEQATMVPGKRPLAALASLLARVLEVPEATVAADLVANPAAVARRLLARLGDGRGLVLFVDQLEELVTLGEAQAGDAAAALAELAALGGGVRLLAAARGDFLTRLARIPALKDALGRALYLLGPLSAEGVREAIVAPAAAKGVRFESETIVDELAQAAGGAGGGLPLLQFALAELYEARDQERAIITASSLSSIGGVNGALARHADDVLARLLPAGRQASRRILLRLVTADGTRARRSERELTGEDGDARAALDALVQGRLVLAREDEGGASYEVAHEALLGAWGTLRDWLHDDGERRVVRERLGRAAAEWERLARTAEGLWRGRQLDEATLLASDELHPLEAAFVAASRRAQRRRTRLRAGALVAAPLALALMYGGLRFTEALRLRRQVDGQAGVARVALAHARMEAAQADASGRRAFAFFDDRDGARGEPAWAEARAQRAAADRAWARASQEAETALMLDGERDDVRALLAGVLLERALFAEAGGSKEQLAELLQRLEVYDRDGRARRVWAAPATLAVATVPAGGACAIEAFREAAGAKPRWDAAGPIADGAAPLTLPPGSYRLACERSGRAPVRYPVLLRRAEQLAVRVDLPEDVPPGFVHVPAGRWLVGSAAEDSYRRDLQRAVPLHEVTSDRAFLIRRHETSYAEWIEFLEALPPAERDARRPKVSTAGSQGALELRAQDGEWRLHLEPSTQAYEARLGEKIRYRGRQRGAEQDWLRMPVSGISWLDAQAYAGWLSTSGRVPGARLCGDDELEHAARGADGRIFPHGNRLDPDDANFFETYGRDSLAFGPDEVGAHPLSASPYGVDDMAGNVFEWVAAAKEAGDVQPLRGGAYPFDQNASRSEFRDIGQKTMRDITVGLRICRDAPMPQQ